MSENDAGRMPGGMDETELISPAVRSARSEDKDGIEDNPESLLTSERRSKASVRSVIQSIKEVRGEHEEKGSAANVASAHASEGGRKRTSSVSVENAELDDESSGPEPRHIEPNLVDEVRLLSAQLKETLLGLKKERVMSGKKKEKEQNTPEVATSPYLRDYTKRYPPDERYKELHDNARIWLVYNDEADIFDADMVGEAADSLDILLVFAGLFAGVLTTFVAQTSQSLAPDNAAITVSLLTELVAVQRASATGAALADIPTADTAPAIARTDIWVNALWFTALALSLASALLAVLSKQWLRQYTSFNSGTPRERALIRQFRYDGMEKWAVRAIIGLLPTALHLALGLFLAGLVVFLAPLQQGLAISVGIISGALFLAYVLSIIIAVVHVQSPYRTTLSDILSTSLRWIYNTVHLFFFGHKDRDYKTPFAYNAKAAEREAAVCLDVHLGATQTANALQWLHISTSSLSAKLLVVDSIGAFPTTEKTPQELSFSRVSFYRLWESFYIHHDDSWVSSHRESLRRWEKMFRVDLVLGSSMFWTPKSLQPLVENALKSDLGLALTYAASQHSNIIPLSQGSLADPDKKALCSILRAMGFHPHLIAIILDPLLTKMEDSGLSFNSVVNTLTCVPPIIWSVIVFQKRNFTLLSPADLDTWPTHIDVGYYEKLVGNVYDFRDSRPFFQDPVPIYKTPALYNAFMGLGWYHTTSSGSPSIHNSVKPLFTWNVDFPGDDEEVEPAPPHDEDAVYEPAFYPPEWPPYPAPTWADAWKAAEAAYKDEEERERSKKWWKPDVGFGSGSGEIRQLVRERLRGGDVRKTEDIEMNNRGEV